MKIGSMKEVLLCNARDVFLFDSLVAGLDAQTLNAYHDVLELFIEFTGNILVEDLTPDHVRLYINNLSDGPNEGEEHTRTVISQYAIIHEWVRWLYAQKFVTERIPGEVKPRLTDLFPVPSSKRIVTYCA
jgi:site-specific recombinase XerD